MGSDGYVFIREIKDEEKWKELKEEFFKYVKKYGEYIQVYEYENFLGTGKHVILVYKGDSPCCYGDDYYLVFPEFDPFLLDNDENRPEWMKEWERFKEIFGEPYKYEIWT